MYAVLLKSITKDTDRIIKKYDDSRALPSNYDGSIQDDQISGDSFANAEFVFSALASEKRLTIISELLTNRSAKPAQLGKQLKIGPQLLHDHLAKLESTGLVKRDGEREYSLTTFGNTIAVLMDTYLFISKHKDYFSDHTFGDMPSKFIRRIGVFEHCKLVKGISGVLEAWKDLQSMAQSYVYLAVPEVPSIMIEQLIARFKESDSKKIDLRFLFPHERANSVKQHLEKIGYKELLKSEKVKERKIQSIQVAVVLSESHSLAFFPNQRGETDMLSAFWGEAGEVQEESQSFHGWCLDYFRFKWHQNDPVLLDSSRI